MPLTKEKYTKCIIFVGQHDQEYAILLIPQIFVNDYYDLFMDSMSCFLTFYSLSFNIKVIVLTLKKHSRDKFVPLYIYSCITATINSLSKWCTPSFRVLAI